MKTLASFALLFLFMFLGTSAMAAPNHLPFISDDYPKARAEAMQHHLPLFVEVWAPW